jgi:hypothetical protein
MLRITDKLGNVNQKPLDLDPPPFARLRIAARGDAATATSPLELEIFAVKPDGSPDDDARIEMRAAEGEAEVVDRVDRGIYLVRYLPPATKTSGSVRVEATSGGQLASTQVAVRAGEGRMAQWPSSLSTQRPWSVSAGLLGGGGATYDGATAGTVLFEAALRLEALPEEALFEIGPGFFSAKNALQPQGVLAQLGLRIQRELVHGLDGHAALLAGLSHQTLSGPGNASQSGWAPRLEFALGANLRLGPGRALAQVQFDIAPAAVSSMPGGLSGVQVLAGYLLTLR